MKKGNQIQNNDAIKNEDRHNNKKPKEYEWIVNKNKKNENGNEKKLWTNKKAKIRTRVFIGILLFILPLKAAQFSQPNFKL